MRGLFLGAALIVLAPGAAWADGCEALTAAMVKEVRTPHRYVNTVTHGGQLVMQTTEMVVGGKQYIKLQGAFFRSAGWGVSDWDADKGEANYREETAKEPATCTSGGSDTLNGEATDVVVSQSAVATERTWISKATGLPMKAERHGGDGGAGITTFEYDNLTAPDPNAF